MTEKEASDLLKDLLSRLGVSRGEVLYLGVDMGRLPLPRWNVELSRNAMRMRESRLCSFLYENIIDILGPNGTILVPSFTYACSQSSVPFVLEETPSEVGPFTNWLRLMPNAVRSLHPIFSVSGVGKYANEILHKTGLSAFGPSSPFGKFADYNVRFVNLGIQLSKTLTYIHHLEQCYGCNHRYNKVMSSKVFMNGLQVEKDFLAYVRWRGIDASVNLEPLESSLRCNNLLIEVDDGLVIGQSALASDVNEIGYMLLADNACSFTNPKVRIDFDESDISSNPNPGHMNTFKLSR